MAGLPVVGSNSPEIGRVVTEEGIGEVCDPIDPSALAEAITTILDNPARYDDGLAAATKKYNWGIEQHKLTDLYDELATRHS
jgi:glycosyltransferase involved in cell wall biosynthesis